MEKSFVVSTRKYRRLRQRWNKLVVARIRRGNCLLSCLAICLLLVGCSEAPPFDLESVRGTVTVDARPLTQGKVMFAPIASGDGLNAGKPAFGRIEPDGSYVLTTYHDEDGAIVGEHWVTIFGADKNVAQVTPVSNSSGVAPTFDRLAVTQKQTVVAGQENQIDIQLTTQDVARYAKK